MKQSDLENVKSFLNKKEKTDGNTKVKKKSTAYILEVEGLEIATQKGKVVDVSLPESFTQEHVDHVNSVISKYSNKYVTVKKDEEGKLTAWRDGKEWDGKKMKISH